MLSVTFLQQCNALCQEGRLSMTPYSQVPCSHVLPCMYKQQSLCTAASIRHFWPHEVLLIDASHLGSADNACLGSCCLTPLLAQRTVTVCTCLPAQLSRIIWKLSHIHAIICSNSVDFPHRAIKGPVFLPSLESSSDSEQLVRTVMRPPSGH